MFAGLLLSAGVAYLVGTNVELLQTVSQWWLLLIIAQFALVIVISAGITQAVARPPRCGLFFVYAATMGLTLGVIVWAYLQTPGGSTAVASAFLSAAARCSAAAALYGARHQAGPGGIGGILFMGVIGLIVAMVVNIFLGSSQINWIISIVGVVIFTALTAWDVQRISRGELAAVTGSMEKGGGARRAEPLPGLHQPVPVPAPPVRRPPLAAGPARHTTGLGRPGPVRFPAQASGSASPSDDAGEQRLEVVRRSGRAK